jgi:predicted regulator of Ras-like GTPase activity (Roadblock/LC7/MglB family)/ribosomal protein L40E
VIICSNCGATNNEADGHICRKCGALLPISNKIPRIRISTKKKDKVLPKIDKSSKEIEPVIKPNKSELHDIPLNEELHEEVISKSKVDALKALNTQNIEIVQKIEESEENQEILKEITPKPYKGSIIADKGVYSVKSQEKIIEEKKINTVSTSKSDSGLIKQKHLEEDMTNVLKFLSKKVTVKPLDDLKKLPEVKEKKEKQIPPSSMNEILRNLLKLDNYIEASAIIQKNGTILASAISSRISDSLFGTITQNLSMIGNDIIEGLDAGKLMNISVRGSEGVLDLAPIDIKGKLKNEIVLIIFSHPKVKSGIIHFAANIVKKQVIEYLGLSK